MASAHPVPEDALWLSDGGHACAQQMLLRMHSLTHLMLALRFLLKGLRKCLVKLQAPRRITAVEAASNN